MTIPITRGRCEGSILTVESGYVIGASSTNTLTLNPGSKADRLAFLVAKNLAQLIISKASLVIFTSRPTHKMLLTEINRFNDMSTRNADISYLLLCLLLFLFIASYIFS